MVGPTTEEIQVVREANNGGVPHGNGLESSSTSHQQKGEQHQGIQLQKALGELCCTVYHYWIWKRDQDLARQFDEIAAKICAGQGMPHKTFRSLVYEATKKIWEEKSLQDWRLNVPANSSSETGTWVRGLDDSALKPEASNIGMHFAPSGFSI